MDLNNFAEGNFFLFFKALILILREVNVRFFETYKVSFIVDDDICLVGNFLDIGFLMKNTVSNIQFSAQCARNIATYTVSDVIDKC